jgi:hypothetical protein
MRYIAYILHMSSIITVHGGWGFLVRVLDNWRESVVL